MNPLLPVVLTLLTTAAIAVPDPGEPPPLRADDPEVPPLPETGNLSATLTLPDGTTATIVLAGDITFLTPNVTQSGEQVLTEPKYLYLQTCWPCPGQYYGIHTPEGVEGCVIGPEERDEWRVCIWPRESGGHQTIPMYASDPGGEALFVWGSGCIVHERDGLPPQEARISGIVLPTAGLEVGGSCPE